jgi:endonuclease/exonuclease/phosphatase family metal-dependent hydrolase
MKQGWLLGFLAAVTVVVALPFPEDVSCETFPLLERSFATAPVEPTGRLTVATLNMAEETDLETVLRDFDRSGDMRQVDVLLLQEVVHFENLPESMPVSLAQHLGYSLAYASADRMDQTTVRGIAILSRFPLREGEIIPLDRQNLGFKQRCRIGIGVTAEGPEGPLRIFNVHFDSRINTADRLRQLRPILESAALFNGPRIVGGDFNTANFFWIRHLLPLPYLQFQGSAVKEVLQAQGYATPFEETGRTFAYLPLKLDWIFFRGLRTLDAGLATIPFSDHHGLWARVGTER